MVIGWAMVDRIDAQLVVSAYEMGRSRRGSEGPAIIHSDRGSQYASELFRTAISKDNCEQSMSRKGNCWDNAVAESFFGTIKSELIYHHNFKTRKDALLSIFEFIEIFYNKQRLNSSLNYLTPEEFELKECMYGGGQDVGLSSTVSPPAGMRLFASSEQLGCEAPRRFTQMHETGQRIVGRQTMHSFGGIFPCLEIPQNHKKYYRDMPESIITKSFS